MGTVLKGVIDTFLERYLSRKLFVFLICTTLLLATDKITGEQWVNIAMIYIGSQAAIDAIVKLRGK